jgi:hypothetical protein
MTQASALKRLASLEALRQGPARHGTWASLDYSQVTESERQELVAIRRLADEAGTLASLTDEQVERAADLIERCQGHRHSRQSGVWT